MSSARDHFVFAKQLIDAKTLAHLREPNHRGLIVLVETRGLFRMGASDSLADGPQNKHLQLFNKPLAPAQQLRQPVY